MMAQANKDNPLFLLWRCLLTFQLSSPPKQLFSLFTRLLYEAEKSVWIFYEDG